MKQQHFRIVVFLVLGCCFPLLNATTCEEKETSHLTLDLVKQSISDAKSLYPICNNKTDETNCTDKDKSLAHLNVALKLLSMANTTCKACPNVTECPEPEVIELEDLPTDCSDVQAKGFNKSGIYEIWPRKGNFQTNMSIEVFCDLEKHGGGWTVIQRRGKFTNQTDFYQDWETYKRGFGNLQNEFWLGNENIFTLSNQGVYTARFDLVDVKGTYKYAQYNSFSIGNETSQYLLQIQHHSGNLSDDMVHQNRMKFSTKDRLNDNTGNKKCPIYHKAGFWFSNSGFGYGCGRVNLNGPYSPGVTSEKSNFWYEFNSQGDGLSASEIKLRRTYV